MLEIPENSLDKLKSSLDVRNWHPQRIAILVGVVFAFLSFALIWLWLVRGNYRPLYTDLAPEDAHALTKKLQEEKVPYRLLDNGGTILVPERVLHQARIDLAGAGLPQHGRVGFEIFDRMNFQGSEFTEQVNYQRALQGELARTISEIQGVEAAAVNLSIPRERLFSGEEAQKSASIFLKLRPGMHFAARSVNAIANMVAASVEGLETKNVTVMDSNGTLLSAEAGSELGGGALAGGRMEARRTLESELESRAQTMLDRVLGAGKAVIKVSAKLNYDTTSVNKEIYTPPQPGGLVSNSSLEEEGYEGGGGPGAGGNFKFGNAPASVSAASSDLNGDARRARYSHKKSAIRYEVNRTVEKHETVPGEVERLMVGVFVDAEAKLSDAAIENLREVLIGALGIDIERGDLMNIRSIAFNNKEIAEYRVLMQKEAQSNKLYDLVKLLVPALVILLTVVIYFIIAGKLLKNAPKVINKVVASGPRELSAPAAAQAVSGGSAERRAPVVSQLAATALKGDRPAPQFSAKAVPELKTEIEQLSQGNPGLTAGLIKQWLEEGN